MMKDKGAAELYQKLERHLKQQSVVIKRPRSIKSTVVAACEATLLTTEIERRDKRLQPKSSCLARERFV